jgi:hypothetical protein
MRESYEGLSGREAAAGETAYAAGSLATGNTVDFYRPAGDAGTDHLRFDFATPADARAYIADKVDVPARDYESTVRDMTMRIYAEQLGGGRFSNVYDLSFPERAAVPKIRIGRRSKSLADFLTAYPDAGAAASGAFLYLADKGSGVPRQAALNLALQESGVLSSLPVVDREALVAGAGGLSVRHLRACGELTIDGQSLAWAGSRTDHEAACQMFGNGNVVIRHHANSEPGARKERIRILEESSRYTSKIDKDSGLVDAGLIATEQGKYQVHDIRASGGMDLFAHDMVMRCDGRYFLRGIESDIRVRSIDSLAIDGQAQGAISVGPLLADKQFAANPINHDPSLGSDAPFINVPMVRLALYEAADGKLHFRLFDGRPESGCFKGVTPDEAAANIKNEDDIIWGCFLDPGRTAKLVRRTAQGTMSYANTHYLQWPSYPDGNYTWVPAAGRPIPSAITLE